MRPVERAALQEYGTAVVTHRGGLHGMSAACFSRPHLRNLVHGRPTPTRGRAPGGRSRRGSACCRARRGRARRRPGPPTCACSWTGAASAGCTRAARPGWWPACARARPRGWPPRRDPSPACSMLTSPARCAPRLQQSPRLLRPATMPSNAVCHVPSGQGRYSGCPPAPQRSRCQRPGGPCGRVLRSALGWARYLRTAGGRECAAHAGAQALNP
jgi:hypothetical protein